MLAPRTAKQARLLRQISQQLDAPKSDGGKMVIVNNQVRKEQDMQLSRTEEQIRERLLPTDANGRKSTVVNEGSIEGSSLFQFREFPMYPGEFVPPEHNTLASLRDELNLDLRAQSLKDAWFRVSGGKAFTTVDQYYASAEGIDDHQMGEIVAALFPDLGPYESRALVNRVLESISKPTNTVQRQLSRTITAEAVGLDSAPNHYSNFLEWMGRMTETKAFKTENAIFQFCRRKFNKSDVNMMYENYSMISGKALEKASADGYTHFHTVLRDFAVKVNSEDSRAQTGVRIDEAEVDPETGVATGFGRKRDLAFVAMVRHNTTRTGSIRIMGKSLGTAFADKSWLMEMLLMPFDEAGFDYRDFDVYLMNDGQPVLNMADENVAIACRMALANGLTKLVPITRVALKKSGLLSEDRSGPRGQHPGFVDGNKVGGFFSKR